MQKNFKLRIGLIVLLAVFSFIRAVFSAASLEFTGQINANNINLRVDATIGAMVICTLDKGQLVEVVSEAYDWYKIRLPKTAPAYIKKSFVECISEPLKNNGYVFPDAQSIAVNTLKCLNAKVIADRVNIRLGPAESSWILGKVDKLTVVSILKDEGSWYKIEPVHQSYGWVNKKFINKETVPVQKEEQPIPAASEGLKAVDQLMPDQLVVEGMISPYGVVLWRKATHKLLAPDKQTYFLKGNRKNLDGLNYHKARVSGKLISPKNSKYPVIQVAVIEVLN